MKLKILKYIFICYILTFFIGNIVYSLLNGDFSLDNILFIKVIIYTQFLLSGINCITLFVNSEYYYYLGKYLFFFPQLICVFIFILLDHYYKENLFTLYIPFFTVQTFFFLRVKKLMNIMD